MAVNNLGSTERPIFKILKDEIDQQKYLETVEQAKKVVALGIEKYLEGNRLAFSFNGGKDCTVLLHLIHLQLSSMKIPNNSILTIYFETPNNFDELVSFVEDSIQRYDLKVEKIPCKSIKEGLEVVKKCHETIEGIFIGSRRTDPYCENLDFFAKTNNGYPDFMRINPILEFSYDQVWEYLLQNELDYCKLYDKGYTSIGSTTNTLPNALLQHPSGHFSPAFHLALDNQQHLSERSGRTHSTLPTPPSTLSTPSDNSK